MKDIKRPSISKGPITKIQITNTETNTTISVMGYDKATKITGVSRYHIQKYINTNKNINGFIFNIINVQT